MAFRSIKYFSLLFIPVFFLFTGCAKELSCENCTGTIEPLPPITSDSLLYYQFTLENKNYQAIAYQNNFIVAASPDWNPSAGKDSGTVIRFYIQPPNTSGFMLAPFTLGLERGIFKFYTNLSANQFKDYFAAGNYTYASLQDILPPYTPVLQNGFAIQWADENGVIWRTDKGSGDQSGSRFTITSRQDATYQWALGVAPIRVAAEFTCKIYDDTGRSKKITNGRLAYFFEKIN